jgi:hypothetical protein
VKSAIGDCFSSWWSVLFAIACCPIAIHNACAPNGDALTKKKAILKDPEEGSLARITSKNNWATCFKRCIGPLRRILASEGENCKYANECLSSSMPLDSDCCCVSCCKCMTGVCTVLTSPITIPLCFLVEQCYRSSLCCCCFSTNQYNALQGYDINFKTEIPRAEAEEEGEEGEEGEATPNTTTTTAKVEDHWLYGTPLSIACQYRSLSEANVRKAIQERPTTANIRGTDGYLPLQHLLMNSSARRVPLSAELVNLVASMTDNCMECLIFALEEKHIDLQYAYVAIPTVEPERESHGRMRIGMAAKETKETKKNMTKS